MQTGICGGVICLSFLWPLTGALPPARADAAFQVRCQYVRYARACNAGDLRALGALLAPGCAVVENYGARPWPLLSDLRLYQSRYGHCLELQVLRVRVSGERAAVIADEVYSPRPAVASRSFHGWTGGFRRERRDVWVWSNDGWRLQSVRVLNTGGTAVGMPERPATSHERRARRAREDSAEHGPGRIGDRLGEAVIAQHIAVINVRAKILPLTALACSCSPVIS